MVSGRTRSWRRLDAATATSWTATGLTRGIKNSNTPRYSAGVTGLPVNLVFEACKTGNPCRITAFNFWILPICSHWQEYWAGEIGPPGVPPKSRFIERGEGAGLQAHLFLDILWVHSKPDAFMESPRFSAEALSNYIQECMTHQGVATVSLGIYQDGIIGKEAAALMTEVRKNIRGA